MLASSIPSKIALPFASSGSKRTIPVPSQVSITPGAASYTDGFPPLTFTDPAAGGIPPFGVDFNGIFFGITAIQQWQSAGGVFIYDVAFSTSIGGYPKGAILESADKSTQWLNLADNNTTDPDGGTPANWGVLSAYGIAAITGLTNSNVTLTPAQYAKDIITLAGALTGNINIIVPATGKRWIFINNTTGAFTVTIKTSGGTGVTVLQGSSANVYCDNTNVYFVTKSSETPSQFSNNTNIATTEFIQRAIGNFSSIRALTSSTILTAADAGSIITCGIGPYTITLPSASSIAPGVSITFIATTNGITITRAGADTIGFGNATSGNSITLNNGDSLTLTWASISSWVAISGSAQLGYSSTFDRSLASSGYQKLPGGLIMQWGTIAPASRSGEFDSGLITLPIAFPTAPLNASATILSGVSAGLTDSFAAVRSLSTTQINVYSGASSPTTYVYGIYWFAIGY